MHKVLNQTNRINQSRVTSILSDLMFSRYRVREKCEIPTVIVTAHCDFIFLPEYFSLWMNQLSGGLLLLT